MNFRFDHNNFNVLDLKKSIAFYEEALGLHETGRIDGPDGAFIIVYMGDGESKHRLELTWLRDRKEPYNLGGQRIPSGLHHAGHGSGPCAPCEDGLHLLRKSGDGHLFHHRPG